MYVWKSCPPHTPRIIACWSIGQRCLWLCDYSWIFCTMYCFTLPFCFSLLIYFILGKRVSWVSVLRRCSVQTVWDTVLSLMWYGFQFCKMTCSRVLRRGYWQGRPSPLSQWCIWRIPSISAKFIFPPYFRSIYVFLPNLRFLLCPILPMMHLCIMLYTYWTPLSTDKPLQAVIPIKLCQKFDDVSLHNCVA